MWVKIQNNTPSDFLYVLNRMRAGESARFGKLFLHAFVTVYQVIFKQLQNTFNSHIYLKFPNIFQRFITLR